MAITEALQDTSVDLVIAGHTHRITNTVVGHIPVIEGVNAGGSYSVAQLMVRNGDVAWVGGATRVAKNLGVAPRADVQAIVDPGERRHGGVAQPGDRHACRSTSADPTDTGILRPRRTARVGDGQHGR